MSTATRRPPKDPLDHSPAAVLDARQQLKLTQQEVADACSVSRSFIAEIELGTRNAKPLMIEKLAALYGCPVSQLERQRVATDAPQPAPDTDDVPELRRVGGS